jgi:hypothetical protein
MLMGFGSLLLAIGILAIPHHESLSELSAELSGGNSRTVIASGMILFGLVLAVVGAIVGASRKVAS